MPRVTTMPKKNTSNKQKPTKPASPACLKWDDSAQLTQWEALDQFREVVVFMAAYGTPGYAQLDEPTRQQFAKLLEHGLLFEYVEHCKQDLIRVGLPTPEDWLGILCAGRLKPGEPLDEDTRQELVTIHRQVWTAMYRHQPGERPNEKPLQPKESGKTGRASPQANEERGPRKGIYSRLWEFLQANNATHGTGNDQRLAGTYNRTHPHEKKKVTVQTIRDCRAFYNKRKNRRT